MKRNEGKKETKSSDAEDEKEDVPIKRKTGGFKGMQKTFGQKFSPKMQRKKTKASVAMMKVFPNELESQKEFDGFTEWLQTFELYRGKQGVEEFEDEGRVVGKFKGSIKIYKLPLPKDLDDHTIMGFDPQFGFFQVGKHFLFCIFRAVHFRLFLSRILLLQPNISIIRY